MSEAGCLSFFPSKNLGGFGDGGMVITNNKDIAEKIRSLRVHGSTVRYIHSEIGTNSRLDALQAAVLRVKLKHLDKWLDGRRKVAGYYKDHLKKIGVLTAPYVPSYNTHTYHLYTLRVTPGPEKLAKFLNDSGIEARTYYPVPLHLQECYKGLGYKKGALKESELAASQTFSIPIYPELGPKELKCIVENIVEGSK
jgi:dTDP-4-amino-4,6-dideoxygalactose transaminase